MQVRSLATYLKLLISGLKRKVNEICHGYTVMN
jgi:hypothetical protein